MEESPVIEINAAKRILRQKGALSGGIFTGTDKVRSGYGNGDCLYFDFHHRVFALADGTERFPWASRDILCRLSDALMQDGVPDSAAGWKDLINRRVYAGQKYQHKTTFSCVAVSGDDSEIALTVAHGGDSAVTAMDSVSGDILFQTERNMVFAGRSLEIVDVTEHRLAGGNVRVILHSDGFDDLFRFCVRQSVFGSLSDAFITLPVDCVGDRLHHVLGEHAGRFEHDDIACIVIDPFRLPCIESSRVLIGGTQPHEEMHYRAGNGNGLSDRWLSQERWAAVADAFLKLGITIQ
ncbi:MAG: hypothetical protein HPY65_13590 [Syntrophaceae bacterium]|nr:hypothetical protein [Syntrophaceae bacterium]